MTILLFALLLLVAVATTWHAARQSALRERAERRGELERDIVRAAMLRGGWLTALDVKTRLELDVEEIEEHLRFLHQHGYCDAEMTSSGQHYYVFRAFDDAPRRAAALEKQILFLARRHSGLLGVGTVALETDLSYLEARQALEAMAASAICAPAGEPDVYRFRGFAEPSGREALPGAGEHAAPLDRPAPERAAPRREPSAPQPLRVVGDSDEFAVDAETGLVRRRERDGTNQ